MIAPEQAAGINAQTSRLVLLRNNLFVSAFIFALLECWRPYFFLTDDNLDGGFPFLTELGQHLLRGQSPFVSTHLFGGHYDLLRDPTYFGWHPLNFAVSLLTATPLHNGLIDILALAMFLLASAGFVALAHHLRREMQLTLSDGWLMFYTQSFTFTMVALATGASWLGFLYNYSALPWLTLGILQKSWRTGIALVALFCLHQLLGGHLLPTLSNSIFLSMFAVGIGLCNRSLIPVLNWFAGYAFAVVIILPLLVPMIDGFFHSARSGGVALEDMQMNNVPFRHFPGSIFIGATLWLINPHPHPYTTYTIALGSSAAAWCLLPTIAGFTRGKWRGIEVVTLVMVGFVALLICRPIWISKVMLHMPLFRSMRWPFREYVQFQFFLHLLVLIRPPGLHRPARNFLAIFGAGLFVLSMVAFPLPPTFNAMNWDRELILGGGINQYWAQVRPLLKPADRIAVIIPLDLYTDNRFEEPYCLLDTYDYSVLSKTINASGYSPAAPTDQFYTATWCYYPFGAFIPSQKAALLAEKPDLKFITLESLQPLKITLSSRDGPPTDLTPFVPPRQSKVPAGPVPP